MARPRTFEKEQVLEAAMAVFWEKGYQETTMEDLTQATGLKPGSLYSGFGNKEALFQKALDHYRDTVIRRRMEILRSDGPLRQRIRDFLFDVIDRSTREDRPPGCLITNSSFELGTVSEASRERIRRSMYRLKQALYDCLREAHNSGELAPDSDPERLSQTLLALVNGLNVLGRTFQDRDQLTTIVKTVLNDLLPRSLEDQP